MPRLQLWPEHAYQNGFQQANQQQEKEEEPRLTGVGGEGSGATSGNGLAAVKSKCHLLRPAHRGVLVLSADSGSVWHIWLCRVENSGSLVRSADLKLAPDGKPCYGISWTTQAISLLGRLGHAIGSL